MTKVAGPSRAQDERLLDMLARRRAGQSAAAIARALGDTRSAVLGQCHRVRLADLAESGEPEDVVERGYW